MKAGKLISSFILAMLFIFLTLATLSCSKKDGAPDGSGKESGPENSEVLSLSSPENTSSDEFFDGLPDINYGNRLFTILQRKEYKYEYASDEQATEKVNMLIAERNRRVEERFGVIITTIEQEGIWGKHEDFISYVRNTIDSGTAGYDIISGYAAVTPTLISDGYFINWYELSDYINFEKHWWAQDFISEMSLNNKLYLLSGDISLTFWESMQCMFFNKTLASAYNLNDIYDVVRDGDWTFDKMYTVIKETYNENSDPNEQVYGYATALTTQIDVYQDAFNIPVTEKDADGRPRFTINQPKIYNTLDMLYDLVIDSPYSKICVEANGQDETLDFFGKGRALFAPLWLGAGAMLQNYDTVYGILPMPKYDVNQTDYHSTCSDFYSVLALPITSDENLDFIGVITEALCVESSRYVVPEYYTLVLKERYTSDEDSVQMIDIVRDGVLCNFGYLYSYTLNWPAHQLNVCINAKNRNFSSNWESKETMFTQNLEEAIKYYFDD